MNSDLIRGRTSPRTTTERRITTAGILVVIGLLIQVISHFWIHPLAFMGFLVVGTPLVAAGVLYFLVSLIAGNEG